MQMLHDIEDQRIHAIRDHVDRHRDAFTGLIQRLVECESPSDDANAQHAPFNILAAELRDLDFQVSRLPGRQSGGQLYARPAGRDKGRPAQLLLGHVDTVWPVSTLSQMPFRHENGIYYGPGIFDMKTGLAMMIHALRAVRELGLTMELTPVIFINSDEEVRSFESRHKTERLARHVARTYVLEPSLEPDGRLKTARRGAGFFYVTLHGIASHSGLAPEKGASAILGMARVIEQLFGLNDPDKGINVNVGTVEGGSAPNVIAAKCRAMVEVRITRSEDQQTVRRAIEQVDPGVKGVTVEVEGEFDHPPVERTPRNRQLWELAHQAAGRLDIPLDQGRSGGASDGSFTSQYTATLDGMGAVGAGAHASHEQMHLEPTLDRLALLTLMLAGPDVR